MSHQVYTEHLFQVYFAKLLVTFLQCARKSQFTNTPFTARAQMTSCTNVTIINCQNTSTLQTQSDRMMLINTSRSYRSENLA